MSALADLRYAYATEVDYFADWCATNLRHSVDRFAGTALVLEPWQLDFFEEALAVDANSQPYWSSVALVVSRKNGKTAMLAALGLYRLLEDEGQPEILLAAASDKQAGRLFDAVLSYLRRNPELDARVHRREYVGEIVNIETGGKIIRLPSSGETLDGYNPSLAICDELHAWQTPTRQRVWGSLNSGGGARERTQVVTITTAGDALSRETSILGKLIDGNQRTGQTDRPHRGLTVSRHHESRSLVFNYSAPTTDPSDLDAMKLANPASWITPDYLSKQVAKIDSGVMRQSEVLQLHGCVWAPGLDAWIDPAAWKHERGATIPDGAAVCVGVDIGLVHDASAAVLAWLRDDGSVLFESKVWTPTPGRKVRLEDVETHLVDLAGRYLVRGVLYDDRFFERSAQTLAEHGLTMIVMPQNSATMADAYQAFYAAAAEDRLRHGGDPVLTAHVLGTAAERSDRGWKVRKMRQSQRIDACVAAVMALYGTETPDTVAPWVGW